MLRGGNSRESSSQLIQAVENGAANVLRVSLPITLLIIAYLLYGLLSGKMADVAHQSHRAQIEALKTVQTVSTGLNLSLIVTLVCGCLLYYEEVSAAVVMLGAAAFFAYGLQYFAAFLGIDQRNLNTHGATIHALQELHLAALILVVPGGLLVLYSLLIRMLDFRDRNVRDATIGQNASREADQPRALIPALAKCWQLPFCREGIRKQCPIYHARTKCWKQRVGCMCEENIIRLAHGSDSHAPATIDMAKGQGFVAIGDLIAKSEAEVRPHIPTRPGPRGVRIPTNPHLSDAQKRDRCRNCVIYNEHQRQKYKLLAPIATLSVPALVYWRFEDIQHLLRQALTLLDQVFGRLTFSGANSTRLTDNVTSSLSVEMILVVCLTLMGMTWALRFLEYCTFKIKI